MGDITKSEVERISNLARIRLSDHEKEKMAQDLGSILGYIDKLKEVNIEGIEPIAHITGLENVLRKDNSKDASFSAVASKLLEMAPDTKNNYVKVKAVFGE